MDILYIDSRMGISGSKLLGALMDMLETPESFVRRFNELGFKGVRLERQSDGMNGISGSRIEFIRVSTSADPYADEIDDDNDEEESRGGFFSRGRQREQETHEHSHRSSHTRRLADIKMLIDELPLNGKIRKRAISVYERIAQASSKANKVDINDMKMRRTGSRDVIASVVGVCMLMDEIEVEKIVSSPIATGSGYAMTYRGRMPIPIPALQNILDKVPYSAGSEAGEICTLEGAALLREFADSFEDMPELVVIRSGAGFGDRKFKSGVNCTRVYAGQLVKTAANASVTQLEAALFDDGAEVLTLLGERLKAAGAMEAYTVPISLLSGGSGNLLKCICSNDLADEIAGEILRNTSTRSVRRTAIASYETESELETVSTSVGEIRVVRTTGFGISKSSPVGEDVSRLARDKNISIAQAFQMIVKEI